MEFKGIPSFHWVLSCFGPRCDPKLRYQLETGSVIWSSLMAEPCESNECKQGKYKSNGVYHEPESAVTVAARHLYNSAGSRQWLLRCLVS